MKTGDYVVTQRTGAVSLFATGFDVKAGTTIIDTISSNEKLIG